MMRPSPGVAYAVRSAEMHSVLRTRISFLSAPSRTHTNATILSSAPSQVSVCELKTTRMQNYFFQCRGDVNGNDQRHYSVQGTPPSNRTAGTKTSLPPQATMPKASTRVLPGSDIERE